LLTLGSAGAALTVTGSARLATDMMAMAPAAVSILMSMMIQSEVGRRFNQ
jgi:hypothetical protein